VYIFLTINLIIALWVYYDSQKHGYSFWQGLLWAVGVFLVLFIFLPFYLFARNKRRKLAAATGRTQAPSSLTRCFYCGKEYEGDPKFCPNCGQNLKFQQ
jgi:uncharacterized membrane protein YvbJ